MKKVIIVDDELVNRKLTESYLLELGYQNDEMLIFNNGKEFLANLDNIDEKEIGYILLDIYMPEVNGIDVIHSLKKSHLKNIPIIVITTDDKLESQVLPLVNSFNVRPISFVDFVKVISGYTIE